MCLRWLSRLLTCSGRGRRRGDDTLDLDIEELLFYKIVESY